MTLRLECLDLLPCHVVEYHTDCLCHEWVADPKLHLKIHLCVVLLSWFDYRDDKHTIAEHDAAGP